MLAQHAAEPLSLQQSSRRFSALAQLAAFQMGAIQWMSSSWLGAWRSLRMVPVESLMNPRNAPVLSQLTYGMRWQLVHSLLPSMEMSCFSPVAMAVAESVTTRP